jgi:hypothetical protein
MHSPCVRNRRALLFDVLVKVGRSSYKTMYGKVKDQ